MDNDITVWRNWQESVLTFVDEECEGMKSFLTMVHAEKEEPTSSSLDLVAAQTGRMWVPDETVKLHRCLNKFTKGQAGMILEGNNMEDGYISWHRL